VDKVVLNASTNSQYSSGYLFFSKQQNLLCQKFDPDNFTLNGDIHNIAGGINYVDPRIMASFSVSNTGNLLFQHIFQISSSLVLIKNHGQQTELPVKSNINGSLIVNNIEARLSPYAEKVLYTTIGNQSNYSEIWQYNSISKINSKFTFNSDLNSGPCWSPDGKFVAYSSNLRIYVKNADGSGNIDLVYKNDSTYYQVADDWSSDGSKLLVNDLSPGTFGWELVIVNLKDKSKKLFLSDLKNTIFNGKFSEDMKWILYTSSQSGSLQIYVRPTNNDSGIWQVTSEGAINGWWVDNDKAIIYLSVDGKVYKVNVSTSGNNFIVGTSQLLFTLQNKNLFGLYDVSADGNTFLAARPVSKTTIPPLTYVQNWKGLINENDK
jgi:Tol biopolymer transport system component